MGLTLMEMLWLGVQVAAGAVTVLAWWRWVLPAVPEAKYPALVLDVWGPIIAFLPLLWLAGRADARLTGASWTPIGGPVALAGVGMGAALLFGRSSETHGRRLRLEGDRSTRWFAIGTWAAAGVVLLMLGAAQELSVWIGQCLFAIAAVLMWMNTPGTDPGDHSREVEPGSADSAAGSGTLLAVIAALVHGYAGWRLAASAPMFASAAALLSGAAVLMSAARWGTTAGVRMSGWTGAIGAIAGLGVLSVLTILPDALRLAIGRFLPYPDLSPPQLRVAVGVGRFALEATGLVLLAGIAAAVPGQPRAARRGLGVVVLAASLALLGWRLASLARSGAGASAVENAAETAAATMRSDDGSMLSVASGAAAIERDRRPEAWRPK